MYTYTYNRLNLIKICLCCFIDMPLYSNNLSSIITISSSIILEIFPACYCRNNNFNLLHNSSGSDDKNIVFGTPEAMIVGDLSNFIRVLSLVDLLP